MEDAQAMVLSNIDTEDRLVNHLVGLVKDFKISMVNLRLLMSFAFRCR